MTSDQNKADWSNYWQGRTAVNAGDALVGGGGVGIEQSTELADFWHSELHGFETDISVLDLACGAGSVLRHAHKMGFTNLAGIDISDAAIAAMQSTITGAIGIVGPVDKMPLKDNHYDLVVSQFGFEYAGEEKAVLNTAKEAVRILKPHGKFVAVCHIEGGGIDKEVGIHLAAINDLEATGFVQASKDFFIALNADETHPGDKNKQAFERASQALAAPRDALTKWLSQGLAGDEQIKQLGQHLFAGAADLFARRHAYALEDITGWLDGMQYEIDAYRGRMSSMQKAALNEKTCEAILDVFRQDGYEPLSPQSLHFGNETLPAAWILKAG